jgi:hypothetical protein
MQVSTVQLVPSLQLATHGFVGGSINAQIGESIYALLGLGRTNTQDYYNLNFDPNDSVLYGIGTSLLFDSNLALLTVRDNRLNTDQVVTHILWKYSPDRHQRWTVDWSSKQGRPSANDDPISGDALAVSYDYGEMFFRLAKDRKVNFTTEEQLRFSVGFRF